MASELTRQTVEEKQKLVRQVRSKAVKIYNQKLKEGWKKTDFKPGAGKGLEPKEEWCECHNRAPCPLDKELGK